MRHSPLPCIFLASAIAAASAAHAQVASPSSRLETVTVTAAKLNLGDVIRTYVKSFAAPSPYLGKIARWESGVCPKVMGLQPAAATLVVDRIKAVAKMVGAPISTKELLPDQCRDHCNAAASGPTGRDPQEKVRRTRLFLGPVANGTHGDHEPADPGMVCHGDGGLCWDSAS